MSHYLYDFKYYLPPCILFTFQYTDYDYGGFYDYTEGELTTDAPPTEQAKTQVTPPLPFLHPSCFICMLL